MNKSTYVIGASTNPERYSYMAIELLRQYKHDVVALGSKAGKVSDVEFDTDQKFYTALNTITLYVNPGIQKDLYSYILSLHPRRLIFNPGTENEELKKIATAHGIECVEACTLVLLRTNQY
ncbi:MAG: CoA-binding protein [Saprospiraceae bacterium]|nr:CoA-binding protein [Saprospiraceae bacterium]